MNLLTVAHPKITIGIVDDNETYRDALRNYFKHLDDMEVILEATDGLQLIEKLKTHQPDVILLDMAMPNMDGMETLKQLRDIYPGIKFIMLTVYMEKALINSFIKNGANTYLNKSAAPDEIYNAIVKCSDEDFYMNDWISDALVSRVKKNK